MVKERSWKNGDVELACSHWSNKANVYNKSNKHLINRSAVSSTYRQCNNKYDDSRENAAPRKSSTSFARRSGTFGPSPCISPIHGGYHNETWLREDLIRGKIRPTCGKNYGRAYYGRTGDPVSE